MSATSINRGGRGDRVVSVVLYLNEAWIPADGGQLRLFDAETARNVEPLAGRLVAFVTAGREHAVLPTQKDRLSLTGWFRRRPQDSAGLRPVQLRGASAASLSILRQPSRNSSVGLASNTTSKRLSRR